MDVSNHPGLLWCRIHKKSHLRSFPVKFCWLLTAQLLNVMYTFNFIVFIGKTDHKKLGVNLLKTMDSSIFHLASGLSLINTLLQSSVCQHLARILLKTYFLCTLMDTQTTTSYDHIVSQQGSSHQPKVTECSHFSSSACGFVHQSDQPRSS